MNVKKTGILLCTALLIISCSTIYDTSYDYDKNIDFNNLKTYAWRPIAEKNRLDQLVIERIKNAVNANLSKKGFKQADNNPDFLIETVFGERQRRVRRYRYIEGHLSIDFVEPDSSRLFWHGSAKADLDFKYTPEKSDEIIEDAVTKILRYFPPPPAK